MGLTVLAIIRTDNLLAVVMLGGIYSFLAATIFVVLDAVDVALTEAAVGAGVATILGIATLTLTTRAEKTFGHSRTIPLVVVTVAGAMLIYATLDMASYGDPDAVPHQHVAPRYIEKAVEETKVPNVVTAVLASYRGYDTLGEVTVIFTAGVGVILLLGSWRRHRRGEDRE